MKDALERAFGTRETSIEGRRFRLFLEQLFAEIGADPHGYGSQKNVRASVFGNTIGQSMFSQYMRSDGTAKCAGSRSVERALVAFERSTGRKVDYRFFKDPELGDNPHYRDHLVANARKTQDRPASDRAPAMAEVVHEVEPPVLRALRYAVKREATLPEIMRLIEAIRRNRLAEPSDEVLDILWREAVRPDHEGSAADRALNATAALELQAAGGVRIGSKRSTPAKPALPRKKGA